MQGDYYSVLGVSPSSEDVVIRAAYRALMRRYHPDADSSDDATERARLINAAYAVLSDPEQRRRYDGTLAARGLIKLEHQPKRTGLRVTPGAIVALAIATAGAALFALAPPLDGLRGSGGLQGGSSRQASPAAAALPETTTPDRAEADCSTDAAKGLIKAELFNRAARLRGSEDGYLTPIADRSLVRLDLAEAKGGDGAGAVSCGGWLAIDLPTDVAVEGGRRNLNAEIIYALVPAGSRGLRLTALSGVNGLAQALATLGAAPDELSSAWPNDKATADVEPSAEPTPPSPIKPTDEAATPASLPRAVSIRKAKPASSKNVAALETHLNVFMAQSLARADAGKTAALARSEARFRKRREACRTDDCLKAVYVRQMRSVSAIMAAKQR